MFNETMEMEPELMFSIAGNETDKSPLPPLDKYEEMGIEAEERMQPRGGGGGGGKKPSATRGAQIKAALNKAGMEKRAKLPLEDIDEVFEKFPKFKGSHEAKRFLMDYADWLKISLESKQAYIDESDIDWDAVRSSGAGGQNVNKTSSKAEYLHIPTNISAESSDTRDQWQNRIIAEKKLRERVQEHFQSWQTVIQGKNTLAGYKLAQKMVEKTIDSNRIDDKKEILSKFRKTLGLSEEEVNAKETIRALN